VDALLQLFSLWSEVHHLLELHFLSEELPIIQVSLVESWEFVALRAWVLALRAATLLRLCLHRLALLLLLSGLLFDFWLFLLNYILALRFISHALRLVVNEQLFLGESLDAR